MMYKHSLSLHPVTDLSCEKHVSAVSAVCFFQLRQIRRVWQSLDAGSAATLIHAFVTSRVDYCNTVLAGSPRFITDKLQQWRVMNSVAHIVSNTRKFDSGLSRLLHDELQWIDATDRVWFKLAQRMYWYLHGTAPLYLVNSCTPSHQLPTLLVISICGLPISGSWLLHIIWQSSWPSTESRHV